MEDVLGDELFDDYVERQPRCRAVTVNPENIYKVAEWLNQQGFHTKVDAHNNGRTLEVISSRPDEGSLFTANANSHDVIQYAGGHNVSHIPGADFRRIWEKET